MNRYDLMLITLQNLIQKATSAENPAVCFGEISKGQVFISYPYTELTTSQPSLID